MIYGVWKALLEELGVKFDIVGDYTFWVEAKYINYRLFITRFSSEDASFYFSFRSIVSTFLLC